MLPAAAEAKLEGSGEGIVKLEANLQTICPLVQLKQPKCWGGENWGGRQFLLGEDTRSPRMYGDRLAVWRCIRSRVDS